MDSRAVSGSCASSSGRAAGYQPRRLRRSVFVPAASLHGHGDSPAKPEHRFPSTAVSGSHDWRAFRAQLVAWERHGLSVSTPPQQLQLQRPRPPPLVSGKSWAHPLHEPEPGCLLLARHDNMNFFNGSVILVTSHNDSVGTIGYVLNKPSPLTVDELQVLGAAAGFKEAFGSQRLHLGGPVHLDHVTLLHRFVGIGRSHQVAEGMFMGGLPDAIRMVGAGLARPSDFLLVLGMSGWSAGQLKQEVDAGFWHVISASPDLLLPSPQWPSGGEVCGEAESPAAQAATEGGAKRSSPMYNKIARLAVRGSWS